MATGGEVLEMLCPQTEYTIWGNEYDSIDWFGKLPAITKAEFEAGFAQVDAWKAEQEAAAAAKAAAEAKLAALGLTSDDLKALGLGGN
jgi:hypothetical protein